MQTDNLPFRIEIWSKDGRVREETLAACSNFYVAKAAFNEAVNRNPKSHVMLCERSRIISLIGRDGTRRKIVTAGILKSSPRIRGYPVER